MKIVVLGQNYTPETIGIGPFTAALSEHLSQNGHRVDVITAFPHYPYSAEAGSRAHSMGWRRTEQLKGVTVHRRWVRLPRNKSALQRIVFDSSMAFSALLEIPRLRDADLVICVSPPIQLGLVAAGLASLKRAPLVLHLQDIVPDAALATGMLREGRVLYLGRLLETWVYSAANQITVISEGFRRNLQSKGVPPEKITVIPNWVDVGLYPGTRDEAFRGQVAARATDILVLYAGSLAQKQDLDVLVRAAALCTDHQSLRFAIVGDGVERVALQSLATKLNAHNVSFCDFQKSFPSLLASAEILTLTQRPDVVDSVAPSKLLGYIAAAKPVVAAVNPTSEAAHLIERSGSGVLVPAGDAQALASILVELSSDTALRDRYGIAGRKYATAAFDHPSVLRRWDALLEQG